MFPLNIFKIYYSSQTKNRRMSWAPSFTDFTGKDAVCRVGDVRVFGEEVFPDSRRTRPVLVLSGRATGERAVVPGYTIITR
jgi:hypothetical protein